jgi:OFA family oxalate/formate antiporter-like MFS transporter
MNSERLPNRWGIALAAICIQLSLGTAYGWSVFKNPLIASEHWSETSVQLSFEFAFVCLGLGAIIGGSWQDRVGPRRVASTAAILYGLGYVVAAIAVWHHNLLGLYIGYGVIAGMGMGMGFVCPIATLVKWFPDKRGLMGGFGACGFGLGPLVMGPFAAREILRYNVPTTFCTLGVAYLIIILLAAHFLVNPPQGWRPEGWEPRTSVAKAAGTVNFTLGEAVGTWQFYVLLLILFVSISAGTMIISQASPMAQEMAGMSVLQAADIVGLVSIFNGLGRIFWPWVSDSMGRRTVYIFLFSLQILIFFLLPRVHGQTLFGAIMATIGLCYGGCIGLLPSTTADYFGPKYMGGIYGLILFGGNFAGIPAPSMIARVHQDLGTYIPAINVLTIALVISLILPLVARRPIKKEAIGGTATALAD